MIEEFKIMAQRFIYPLFFMDDLGGYRFSSTMTFVKYKNENFSIFAAHALPPTETLINKIGALKIDGSFMPLSEITKLYTIDRSHDIVICNTTMAIEQKNYFDLDFNDSTTEFNTDAFGWIGFPKNKAKQQYHRTKSSAHHIASDVTELDDGSLKWSNANYLLIGVSLLSLSEVEIKGHFENKNVTYEKEGFKTQAYSLRGMSGGALFHGPNKIKTQYPTINDLYKFAGIGLEHHASDKIVKGASAQVIKNLIEELLTNQKAST